MEALCHEKQPYMDGTFHIAPPRFLQFFTIASFMLQRLIPRLYILMTHKSEQMYTHLWTWLQQEAATRGLPFNWNSSMSDFESGVMLSLQNTFGPAFLIKGY